MVRGNVAANGRLGPASGESLPLARKFPDPLPLKPMAEDIRRPTSPDKMARSSFSSVRESDSDLAQTFTLSKVSSYHTASEHAVDDSPNTAIMAVAAAPPLTRPHSRLHYTWFPSDGFKGWKEINVGGKLASKSFGDLQGLNIALSECTTSAVEDGQTITSPARPSILERMPLELFAAVVEYLVVDVPPNGVERRNVDLISLLLTSKEIHTKTVGTVYRRVTIPHSRIFQKFLTNLRNKPWHGTWVRRLDFAHFNPGNLFSTGQERAAARNLTSHTLLECLNLTPNLQEFMAQEYIDDDLSAAVLRKLLLGLENLQAVDFCGCSSLQFKNAFASAPMWNWPSKLEIQRLSFHKCTTLPASVFEMILPRLPRLTHLDVAGTKVTDAALDSIPRSARITHLNLARCKSLTAEGVTRFLSEHPAVRNSGLVFLSLATDIRTDDSLPAADVSRILGVLPNTLRSLNLKGSKMDGSHIPLLLPLTKHLEELALGHGLKIGDVNRLFAPDPALSPEEQMAWVPSALKYVDVSDMWGSESLSDLFNDSILLTKQTQPLEVIEVSDEVAQKVKKSTTLTKRGWQVSEVHVRSWFVRTNETKEARDDGRRPWKMGAQFWGMRKVPIAVADVGGMYGSYMFGRNL